MKCVKCGNECHFKESDLLCIDAELCPNCGALISSDGEQISEPHFVLRYIADNFGKEIFLNPKRLLSIFSDILPKEKNISKTLYVALFDGAGKNLLSVYEKPYEERSLMAAKCVKSLRDGIGMKSSVSAQVIEWISYALGYHITFKKNNNLTEKAIIHESKKNITESDEQAWLGLFFDNKKEYHSAFYWYEKAALGGNSSAQMMLGRFYSEGLGGAEKSIEKAFVWYERAANAGIGEAQCMLGHFYAEGIGCVMNENTAFSWYKRSARANFGEAQYIISLCFKNGFLVGENSEKAYYWNKKSEENGYNIQINHITHLPKETQNNSSDEIYKQARFLATKKDYSQAKALYEKAAEQGNIHALCSLGKLYYMGEGTEKDTEKAYMCFKKSADCGYDIAQYNLGIMYLKGVFVGENKEAAKKWFSKAADQGHREAIKVLNKMNNMQ